MKIVLKIVGALLGILVLFVAGVYVWASMTSSRLLARTIEAHTVDFPVPFPLTDEVPEELGLDEEGARQFALDRALERGRHLVEARYGCMECHGSNFGGGVMVDAPPIGRILGPNLTTGSGSRTTGFNPADWDRIVRHGIRSDGTPAAMPSMDFKLMSDQELSDIITYVQSQPPVDNEVPPVTLGPLGKVLMATGQMPLSADLIEAHDVPHMEYPPATEATVEFGRHLAGVCTGCHGPALAGGPIPGGDPAWVPARNLTPHAEGLAGWSYGQFATAIREGRRPDGTELRVPMTFVIPYALNMTDVELEALWMYVQSVPAAPTGG